MENTNSIFRIKQVIKKSGLSRSSIYARMKKDFPQPIKLGERSVGWLESDINNWISSRIQLSAKRESVGGHNA